MSDQADQQNSFAREIYLAFVTRTGPYEWDWQKLANAAFDAADQFSTVSQQRLNPQTSVPISSIFPSAPAAPVPVPGQIPATDPAAAAAVPPPADSNITPGAPVQATPAS